MSRPRPPRPDPDRRRAPVDAGGPGTGPDDRADDRALVARAREGDTAAFAALYDRHVRPVYWQAFRVVRDADLAEDVAQETFVVAWRRVREIRVVDVSVLPWLLVTARHCGLNAGRRAAREHPQELDADLRALDDVEAAVEADLARVEIEAAVAALSEPDRRLYALCLEGDLSYQQAARELGVSHAAVRNRLHRLRSRLRADLHAMREPS